MANTSKSSFMSRHERSFAPAWFLTQLLVCCWCERLLQCMCRCSCIADFFMHVDDVDFYEHGFVLEQYSVAARCFQEPTASMCQELGADSCVEPSAAAMHPLQKKNCHLTISGCLTATTVHALFLSRYLRVTSESGACPFDDSYVCRQVLSLSEGLFADDTARRLDRISTTLKDEVGSCLGCASIAFLMG